MNTRTGDVLVFGTRGLVNQAIRKILPGHGIQAGVVAYVTRPALRIATLFDSVPIPARTRDGWEARNLLFAETEFDDPPCCLLGENVQGLAAQPASNRIASHRGSILHARRSPLWPMMSSERSRFVNAMVNRLGSHSRTFAQILHDALADAYGHRYTDLIPAAPIHSHEMVKLLVQSGVYLSPEIVK